MANQGQAVFHARLQRINAGQFSRVPQPGVGDETKRAWATKRTRVSKSDLDETAGGTNPLACLWALVTGILAFGLSQLASFHFAGLPDPTMSADMRMGIDALFAVGMLLSFSLFFDIPGKMAMLFKLVGIFAAMSLMHNFVHLFPDVFRTAFSWEWVRFVQSGSEPVSILFRGESISVADLVDKI
ncbi:MAG: hypothetical protein EP318_11135 [Rhodobacteraceae bacterium]|nr:MAG: hypothetical protein EP318_11135 [Paracoccaceae bacterium]